jgi:SAM-dependent methyltransferase
MLFHGMRVLHVAPEASLQLRVRAIPGIRYVEGDNDDYWSTQMLDVTDLQFPDASFDAVICNHVLEHVPDDRRAMSEIRRVLAPGGWAMLLVPDVRDAATQEDLSITDPAERKARYGQVDHVRLYGWDYVDRLEDAGFVVQVERPEDLFDAETIERCRLKKFGELEPLFFAS